MVHAKNYETMSTFVKVMQKKLWPLFSGHGVHWCMRPRHRNYLYKSDTQSTPCREFYTVKTSTIQKLVHAGRPESRLKSWVHCKRRLFSAQLRDKSEQEIILQRQHTALFTSQW